MKDKGRPKDSEGTGNDVTKKNGEGDIKKCQAQGGVRRLVGGGGARAKRSLVRRTID